MARDASLGSSETTSPEQRKGVVESEVVRLHAESAVVSKKVRRTLVRATRTTVTRSALVEEDLAQEHVVVERVPIGKVVDTVPPVRQEGDVTILSVVQEEVVVSTRLVLKEEVHLRRVRHVERHTETVSLREQHLVVTRTDLDE